MAGTEETEVKDVERVEVTPSDDDELVTDETEDTDADSSQQETEGDEDESKDESKKPDELVRTPTTAKDNPQESSEDTGDNDGLADVPGETPVERARRHEITRLKSLLRSERKGELLDGARPAHAGSNSDLTDNERAVISKYKPEEISALKEVFPVLAKEMGFVLKGELETNTFMEKSQDVLDTFLEKHPEYLPENDTQNVLWSAFKAEFARFKTPNSPKEYQIILDKVHKDVFGIKPSKGALPTINAQREKTKIASHAGASSTQTSPKAKPATASASGARVDMLKGFTDEEKADLFGDDE